LKEPLAPFNLYCPSHTTEILWRDNATDTLF
jgi:hypothetical protein